MKLSGSEIIIESLKKEGVDFIFGYPGGAILPAYDALLDYPIRHVLVRHEQGATHACLKARSPSCGIGQTHGATGLMSANGVTAAALKKAGLKLYSDEDMARLIDD